MLLAILLAVSASPAFGGAPPSTSIGGYQDSLPGRRDPESFARGTAFAPEDSVDLEEAVELAIENAPAVTEAAGSVRVSRATERTARGAFLPDLSLTSTASLASTERFNPQTNTTVRGSGDTYSTGVTSSMEVFTAGRRGAELRQARGGTALAEAELVERRYETALAAKGAFFDVLRAQELLRVAEARVRRAGEQMQATSLRLGLGAATLSDSLRTELELTNARQELLQAETQLRISAFALGRLVGAAGAVGARSTAEELEPRPLALVPAELEALVGEDAPAVRAREAAVAATRAGIRAARAQYFPSVQLSGDYDWFNQDLSLADGRGTWTVRLGLSYPVFNGFLREETIARAQVEARNAEAQLADEYRAARAELERLTASLLLAEEQIELARGAVRVAEEDLRVQRERYRVGASTILDQITSQLNLVEAERDLVVARYDYQIARAELEALAGRDL